MEPEFDGTMNNYGVPVFHAKEFHDTRDAFKGWKRTKKRSFTEQIFSTAGNRMMGISISLRRQAALEAKQNASGFHTMSPMGVAFAVLLFRLVSDRMFSNHIHREGISFLLESGNKNSAEIEQYFHKMAAHPFFRGCLRSITFIPKSYCRAIQVADFFAFYSRRDARDRDRFDNKLALPSNEHLKVMRDNVPMIEWTAKRFSQATGKHMDDLTLEQVSALYVSRRPRVCRMPSRILVPIRPRRSPERSR